MKKIKITRTGGSFQRKKNDVDGNLTDEIETIEYGSDIVHVTDGKSNWLVDPDSYSDETKDDITIVKQNGHVLVAGQKIN